MKFVAITLIFMQICAAQNVVEKNGNSVIDFTKMTELTELKYADEIKFYLGKDKQTIVAEQNGKLLWTTNIIEICGKPLVGKPKIRKVWIKENSVILIYGKHSYAKINIIRGHRDCLGSD